MSTPDIDSLIQNLSQDLKPVKPLAHPFARIVPIFLGALVYTFVAAQLLGIRHDFNFMLSEPHFLFETILAFAVAVTSALAAAWLCVPDVRDQKWLVSLPFVLVGVFATWMSILAATQGMDVSHFHWHHCFNSAALFGFIPAAMIVFLTTRGAPTKPFTMAITSALMVLGLGYIGLKITCSNDEMGHALLYHLLPFTIFGATMGGLARYIYRW